MTHTGATLCSAPGVGFLVALFLGFGLRPQASELPGGWESRDSGNSGLLVAVSFADDRVGWASGIRVVKRTTNGGRTWEACSPTGAAYWFNSVIAVSEREALVAGFPYGRPGGGVVLRTTDGGTTWTPVTVSANADASFNSLVCGRDRRPAYVIATTDGLMRSRDGGMTWQAVALPSSPTRIWIATREIISLPDDATVIVGGDGALVRSDDAGETWRALPLPGDFATPNGQFAWVHFATPQHGWVGLAGTAALETADGGTTWTRSAAPGRVFSEDAGRSWAIGRYELSCSTDGGLSWGPGVRIGGGNFALVAMAFTGRRAVVVGGTEGVGTSFIADRLLPGLTEQRGPDGVVPITFALPQAGYATLQILDAEGAVVRNLSAGKRLPAGEQTVWWDLSTFNDFWPPFARSQPHLWEPPHDAPTVAEPGTYRWRGLWHPGLSLEYRFSYYPLNTHGLAWLTPDGRGGWLGDHQAPQDVVRAGDSCWVGAFNEAGHCLLEADAAMRKLWGSARLDLACPRVLAAAGDFVYFLEEGGWLGFGGKRLACVQVNRQTKAARRLFAVGADEKAGAVADLRDIAGLAVCDNRAYIASRAAGALVICDLAENLSGKSGSPTVVGAVPLPAPGRVRPYDDRRLAAVSADAVVLVDRETLSVSPLVKGLIHPLGLAVDANGNVYVGEMDPSHQVRVFSPLPTRSGSSRPRGACSGPSASQGSTPSGPGMTTCWSAQRDWRWTPKGTCGSARRARR